MTSDQVSVFVQREDRESKFPKMSVDHGLACRFSEVQMNTQQQSS